MILPLEHQVSSVELSNRLKELGVKQESIFYWANGSIVLSINLDLLLENNTVRTLSGIYNNWPDEEVLELYSAFTVCELLELLPIINGNPVKLIKGFTLMDTTIKYCCRYDYDDSHNEYCVDINAANSCSKRLIYVVENNLVSDEWKKQYLNDKRG